MTRPLPFRSILFDLDDTLLGNDMAVFLPRYFPLLAGHALRLIPNPTFEFIPCLLAATRDMISSADPGRTNFDVFWASMARQTGVDWLALGAPAYFDKFYRDGFHKLRDGTTRRPAARPLVEGLIARGIEVVIATNPLFPPTAIEARLDWAGLPPAEIPFTLITSMDNMHYTKPNPAYYVEILDQIGRRPADVLMVGNDWKNDIEPAAALGISCYWIRSNGAPPPAPGRIIGCGTLADLAETLRDGWI